LLKEDGWVIKVVHLAVKKVKKAAKHSKAKMASRAIRRLRVVKKVIRTARSVKIRVKARHMSKVKARPARKIKARLAAKPIRVQARLPKKPPRKERDAFEERIASKLPKVEVGPNPIDVEKITAILADSRVRQMLIELGGENALAIIRNFYGNRSDEELSKTLKLKISDVRATLNKLHNEGLVNYIREKDSDTGWYSYSWSLNIMRMERWAGSQSLKVGDLVDSQYYFCPSCGESSITNFDSAAEDDFRCERCNKLLDFIDEKKLNELITGKKQ
jgi:transcription initiation factor TFIIE subunit alpha